MAGGCSPRDGGVSNPTSVGDLCRPNQEAVCIDRSQGMASRKGNLLRLKLEDGKSSEFRGELGACAEGEARKCVIYRLDGYRPTEGLFVVAESHSDQGRFLVVDRRTGGRTTVENRPPRFSPLGSHFVGVASATGRMSGHDLAVWSAGGAEPRLVWSHDPPAQGDTTYEFLSWQGENTVLLGTSCRPTASAPWHKGEARIVRSDAGWTLEKPEDCP